MRRTVKQLEDKLTETQARLAEISKTIAKETETKPVAHSPVKLVEIGKKDAETQTIELDEENNGIEEGVVEVISSTCWYASGKIEQIDRDLLIDSGSTYTIIDVDLYNMIPEQQKSPLRDVQLKLRSANGEILKVHGETVINITVGNVVFRQPVKVVSLGDKSAILGLDFMTNNDCVLYLSKGVMRKTSIC